MDMQGTVNGEKNLSKLCIMKNNVFKILMCIYHNNLIFPLNDKAIIGNSIHLHNAQRVVLEFLEGLKLLCKQKLESDNERRYSYQYMVLLCTKLYYSTCQSFIKIQ